MAVRYYRVMHLTDNISRELLGMGIISPTLVFICVVVYFLVG